VNCDHLKFLASYQTTSKSPVFEVKKTSRKNEYALGTKNGISFMNISFDGLNENFEEQYL